MKKLGKKFLEILVAIIVFFVVATILIAV